MADRIKRLRHKLEYGALRALEAVLGVLPLGCTRLTARLLGLLAFDVLRIRRKVTLDNLALALGDELTPRERIRAARGSYGSIATTFAELLVYPRIKPRLDRIIDTREAALLDELYARGKGIILIAFHYGSWELAGAVVTGRGIPMTAVGKTQSNRSVDRLLNGRRNFMDIKVVPRGVSVRHLVKALRAGESIALVSDQNAGRYGIMAPFFGQPASTPSGAAELALRYRAPVAVMACERTARGHYTYLCRELPYDADDTPASFTARMNRAIEDIVRRRPEQYFWMHRRWRTRTKTVPGGKDTEASPGGEV